MSVISGRGRALPPSTHCGEGPCWSQGADVTMKDESAILTPRGDARRGLVD